MIKKVKEHSLRYKQEVKKLKKQTGNAEPEIELQIHGKLF